MSLPTRHIVFHDYRWDGIQRGSVIDVDIAMLYLMIKEFLVFGTEALEKIFPGILETEIHFGFESVPGFVPEFYNDPEAFDHWLDQCEILCLDCGGQFGESNRIIENVYHGKTRKSATMAVFEMLMELDGFVPDPVLEKWVEEVDKTDTSDKQLGVLSRWLPLLADQMIGCGNGDEPLDHETTLRAMRELVSGSYTAEQVRWQVAQEMADHQLGNLPYPWSVGERQVYIGSCFHELTARVAKIHKCDIVVLQNAKGQIQILTHQAKYIPVDLKELVKIIRVLEAGKRGNWDNGFDEEDLLAIEHSIFEPCWFALTDEEGRYWLLVNGGPKHPEVEPTTLTLEDIRKALIIFLNEDRYFQSNQFSCSGTSCIGADCPWFGFKLNRCQNLQ